MCKRGYSLRQKTYKVSAQFPFKCIRLLFLVSVWSSRYMSWHWGHYTLWQDRSPKSSHIGIHPAGQAIKLSEPLAALHESFCPSIIPDCYKCIQSGPVQLQSHWCQKNAFGDCFKAAFVSDNNIWQWIPMKMQVLIHFKLLLSLLPDLHLLSYQRLGMLLFTFTMLVAFCGSGNM